jgi:3-deoxy-manno-octulosonate cytidylyltransferase (CMP-KDO synthetase)
MCDVLEDTYVATCDQEIYDYIESINGKVIMTASSHDRASDRAAEAMIKIEEATGGQVDVLAMVQGDEPMNTPEMVAQALTPMMQDEKIQVVNLMGQIDSLAEFEDPNTVKVVVGPDGNAIYFSREPIPSRKKDFRKVPMLKQICIIPFRRHYLLEFNNTKQTILEQIESVDMLRVIESGGRVRMVMTKHPSIGVDTPKDLEIVRELMTGDLLMQEYLS